MRLDKELVNRSLVPTRSKAEELIKNNYIKVNNKVINKPSFDTKETDIITIIDNDTLKYVSRGGLKLEKAINSFNLNFKNKIIMDIGSSTGGFTDCSLKYGASKVVAIDVGTNVMVDSLRYDNRVDLHEQLNIKEAPSILFKEIDIIVSDVSFISIKRVLDRIVKEPNKYELVFLIKPQFECGKEIADTYKGIILNKEIHINILKDIISYFKDKGYFITDLTISPIHGGDGNIEYLAHFTSKESNINITKIVNEAFGG